MEDLVITSVWDSGLDDDPGCWLEIKFRLGPNDIAPPTAVATVRVFCTSNDLSVSQLKDEGRLIAAHHLSRILELVEVPEIPEDLRRRWR